MGCCVCNLSPASAAAPDPTGRHRTGGTCVSSWLSLSIALSSHIGRMLRKRCYPEEVKEENRTEWAGGSHRHRLPPRLTENLSQGWFTSLVQNRLPTAFNLEIHRGDATPKSSFFFSEFLYLLYTFLKLTEKIVLQMMMGTNQIENHLLYIGCRNNILSIYNQLLKFKSRCP